MSDEQEALVPATTNEELLSKARRIGQRIGIVSADIRELLVKIAELHERASGFAGREWAHGGKLVSVAVSTSGIYRADDPPPENEEECWYSGWVASHMNGTTAEYLTTLHNALPEILSAFNSLRSERDALLENALTPEEADLADRGGYTQALRKKLRRISGRAEVL